MDIARVTMVAKAYVDLYPERENPVLWTETGSVKHTSTAMLSMCAVPKSRPLRLLVEINFVYALAAVRVFGAYRLQSPCA